jgi:hypothetical protein
VVKSESEMRQLEQEYVTIRWSQKGKAEIEEGKFSEATVATPSIEKLREID